jgi:hypothetical protein
MFLEFTVNQWGLISDIFGVLLLFKYGLPSKIEDEVDHLTAPNVPEEEKQKRKRKNKEIIIGAYVGLTLILIGFALQFAEGFK